MPAPFGVQGFTIDSTMELPADEYTAELERSGAFLAAADTDQVTLDAGLIDRQTQVASTVRHLEGGIDEYELTLTNGSLRARIRGRDKLNEILERPFQKLFLLVQPGPQPKLRAVDEFGNVTFVDQPPGTIGPDETPFVVGTFRASEIAREVVTAAGLSLAWQCRDYTLLEDFNATGRSVDILRKLVEPWSLVPMFQVDLFVQGSTVFLRARKGTGLTPDYTFTAKDSRINQLSIRRRRSSRFGKVALQGKLVPKGLTGSGVTLGATEVEETTFSQTLAPTGSRQILTRVLRTDTYRMPDRILLKSIQREYDNVGGTIPDLKLMREETTFKEYEQSRYNASGAVNQPREVASIHTISGVLVADKTKTFQVIEKQDVGFSYNADGFQDMTSTRKFKLNLDKKELEEFERIIRTIKEAEHLKVEQTTARYQKEGGEFVLVQVDTQISAGLQPGGTRPPRAIGSGGTDQTPKEPLERVKIVSTDPKAADVRYANANLEQADLAFIMDQFTQTSGKWEYELALDYVSMPWLRKGSILHITTLLAEDGVTPIPLDPALVVEQSLNFDESGESPSMTSRLRALFWN